MRRAVRDFSGDVRSMMAKISSNIQTYSGASGEESIPTITTAGMQQASTEALAGLTEVSTQAKKELQGISAALQEVQLSETARAAELRSIMGADGSGSGSAYSEAVNEFPLRGEGIADKTERAVHKMEKSASDMEKEVASMEGKMFGQSGAVDLAIGRERSPPRRRRTSSFRRWPARWTRTTRSSSTR
jgi:hypothetical protein